MGKDYTETCEDPRPVPPIGWCAECIREASWVRAATIYRGTGLCAVHLLSVAHATDGDTSLDQLAAETGESQDNLVRKRLSSELQNPARTVGF